MRKGHSSGFSAPKANGHAGHNGSKKDTALVTLREGCRLTGLCPNTLRNWSNAGKIGVARVGPRRDRRFYRSELLELCGLNSDETPVESHQRTKVVIYARCSTHAAAKGFAKGEESDLKRQIDYLKEHAKEHYQCENPVVYSDISSGLNFNRKSFNKLLDDALAGKLKGCVVLCKIKDRFARFGTELAEKILEHGECQIVYVDKVADASEESEVADDVIAILTSFASRVHSRRAKLSVSRNLSMETLERAKELLSSGNHIRMTLKILNREGHRSKTQSGKDGPITRYLLKQALGNDLIDQLITSENDTAENSVGQFFQYLRPSEKESYSAVQIHDVFLDWADENGYEHVDKSWLASLVGKKFEWIQKGGRRHYKLEFCDELNARV